MKFAALKVLSEKEMDEILAQSFRLLEKVGMCFDWDGAMDPLESIGCVVDRESRVVKIPEKVAWDAIKSADLVVPPTDNPKSFYAVWAGMNIIDFESKKKRPGTLQDVKDTVLLTNHLENITVSNAGVVPQDVPIEICDLYAGEVLLTYSEKLFTAWNFTVETAMDMMEMAMVVTGGREELEEAKLLNVLVEPISPLRFQEHTLRIMKIYADFRQPVSLLPMVQTGTTGPATVAGALVLQMAENIGGLAFVHALGDRSPTAIGGGMHVSDLRTARTLYAAPEMAFLHLGVVQLGHHLGMPIGTTSGLCDSNTMDYQAGWERAFTGAMTWGLGSETLGMVGIVGADEAYSHEQLVLDNEKAGFLTTISEGVLVNDSTLALDLIKEVGPGGSFKGRKATVEELESWWRSELFSPEKKAGGKSIEDLAHEKVRDILENNELEPQIDEDQIAEIRKIREARLRALKK